MSDSRGYPHDPIEEIQPDVFMVSGEIKMNALMTITRNMATESVAYWAASAAASAG